MAVRQGYGKLAGTDALVFGYDMGDMLNSFKGKPTTNLLTRIGYDYGEQNSNLFKSHYGYEEVYIPALGKKNAHFCEIYNDYNGGSGNCCLSLFSFGNFSVSPSTTYTYQIIYKTTTGYANGNYMYHYEYGPGGYVTEYGLWSSSREEDLGDGWKHAWGTFTTNANTSTFYTYLFHYEYATFNKVQLAGVMLTQGSEIFRPQQFIPVGNGLTNTGGLLDLTGNSLIDISGISFTGDGQFTFDGTNDQIVLDDYASIIPYGTNVTVEAVVRFNEFTPNDVIIAYGGNGSSDQGFLFQYEFNSGLCFMIYANPNFGIAQLGAGESQTYLNQYIHMVGTYDGQRVNLFINGSLAHSVDFTASYPQKTSFRIGNELGRSYYSNMSLPVAKVYNRALNDTEVFQNFNHYKSRYNL